VPQEEGKANAQAAITDAEATIASALKQDKDVSEAIWRLSAAKTAFDTGDYKKAEELAGEAMKLAESAKKRPAGGQGQPGASPSQPAQAEPGLLSAVPLILIGIGVIAVAAAVYYLAAQRAPKKK